MSSLYPSTVIQAHDVEHEARSFSSSYVWMWFGLAELENALESLRLAYRNTTQKRDVGHGELVDSEVIDCCEWNAIADEYLNLNIAASKIHETHLQESVWWKYVRINPGLMPEIARWYEDFGALKRQTFKAQVKDKQSRFEAERYRRQSARRTSTHSSIISAYESPFRYQSDNATSSSIGDLSSARAPPNFTKRARWGYLMSNAASPIPTM